MDLFGDDKLAYVLGLLATAISWHVSKLTEEIRTSHAVAYSIVSEGARGERIVLENVSTKKSVIDLPIQLLCPKTLNKQSNLSVVQPCMGEDDISLISYPPTLAPSIPMVSGRVVAHNFNVSIAAGGKFGMEIRCLAEIGCPQFFILPAEGQSSDVILIERESIRGFFVIHYFTITVASLALIGLVMLGLVAASLRSRSLPAERTKRRRIVPAKIARRPPGRS